MKGSFWNYLIEVAVAELVAYVIRKIQNKAS